MFLRVQIHSKNLHKTGSLISLKKFCHSYILRRTNEAACAVSMAGRKQNNNSDNSNESYRFNIRNKKE